MAMAIEVEEVINNTAVAVVAEAVVIEEEAVVDEVVINQEVMRLMVTDPETTTTVVSIVERLVIGLDHAGTIPIAPKAMAVDNRINNTSKHKQHLRQLQLQ
jgi:hypothetical protein